MNENNIINVEQENNDTPKWKLWQAVVVLIAANFIAIIPAFFMGVGNGANLIGINLISFFLQAVCFCLVPLYIVCLYYKQSPTLLGIKKLTASMYLKAVLWASLFYFINIIVSMLQTAIFSNQNMELQSILLLFDYAVNGFEKYGLIFCIVVLAPISEETLFRAFLYPPLKQMVGRKPAMLFAAILFAAVHGSVWVFLPMLVGGFGFVWLYDRYHNLAMNIFAHMTWNIIALLLFFATQA